MGGRKKNKNKNKQQQQQQPRAPAGPVPTARRPPVHVTTVPAAPANMGSSDANTAWWDRPTAAAAPAKTPLAKTTRPTTKRKHIDDDPIVKTTKSKKTVVDDADEPISKSKKAKTTSKNKSRSKKVVEEDEPISKSKKATVASTPKTKSRSKNVVDDVPITKGKGKKTTTATPTPKTKSRAKKVVDDDEDDVPITKSKRGKKTTTATPAPKTKYRAKKVVDDEDDDVPITKSKRGKKTTSAPAPKQKSRAKKVIDDEDDDIPITKSKGKKTTAAPKQKSRAKKVVDDDEDEPIIKGKGKKTAKAAPAPAPAPKPRSKKVVDDEDDEPIVKNKNNGKNKKNVRFQKSDVVDDDAIPIFKGRKNARFQDEDDVPIKSKGKGKTSKKVLDTDDSESDIKPTQKSSKASKPVKVVPEKPVVPKKRTIVDIVSTRYGISDRVRIKRALEDLRITAADDFVDLDKSVLIIDEVHNLFKPPAHQKKQYQNVERHLVSHKLHPTLKVVILTATPGSTVKDCLVLLNIVNDAGKPVINGPDPNDPDSVMAFKEQIRGLVSYYEMSGDASHFPRVDDSGPQKYPMSSKQFEKYMAAYMDVKAEHKDYDTLAKNISLNKYWMSARRYSNMIFNYDKSLQLGEFSVKLPPLLAKIDEFPDQKHYVYSAFFENRGSSQGILEVARQLDARGYTKMSVVEAVSIVKGLDEIDDINKAVENKLSKGKRYILALTGELGDGLVGPQNMNQLMKVWNSRPNADGSRVHCFLASQTFNESLDMKDVRHVHIFEPLVTMAADQQTIGRARRFCSHLNLPHDQWTVKLHRYFADLPDGTKGEEEIIKTLDELKVKVDADGLSKKEKAAITKEIKELEKLRSHEVKAIDDVIYNEAKIRMKDLFTVYKSMEESAVDCVALVRFHENGRKGIYEDFKCM